MLAWTNIMADCEWLIRPEITAHVAKLGEITGKTRVLYSELGEITGKTRDLPGGGQKVPSLRANTN